MRMILWAFGSMLVFLVVAVLLPIGLTFKGKLISAFAGLVLALAGIFATALLSIWQTIVILCLLIICTAYILNRRLESILYSKTSLELIDDNGEELFSDYEPIENHALNKKSSVSIGGTVGPELELIGGKEIGRQTPPQKEPERAFLEMAEEEDLFPLLEREEADMDIKDTLLEPSFDGGYLSEIESLLEENQKDELLVLK